MTDNLTPSPILDTKHGSSETSSKTRIKRKTEKIKEVEAAVVDGKIVAGGEEYIIENYQDFNVALGMCQTESVEAMEVSPTFFEILSKGKPTPFIIYGNPAVKVFPQGRMEKGLRILELDRDKYMELVAKKARDAAAKKKAEQDEITSLD